ncbi:MAG: type I-E CRISPR-associated endonuclease Cas1 [Deltaproteobacteria bacterium]|nr:type I-E CRISPR-associated endonuclease Cas1 [Deltaproteobacteria bacterium]
MTGSALFKGRLGLAESRIPHRDRHGLLWLERGNLYVKEGSLHFLAAGSDQIAPGDYAIPYQTISFILMGPGTTVSHDVLRILARHGTLLAAIGEGGVKFYTAPPMGQGRSEVARTHAALWANKKRRIEIARRMYMYRFGEVSRHKDIEVLRGIEGARMKKMYEILARKYGVPWKGRRYNRASPEDTDLPNMAINHAATFVEAAADIAVAALGALPPLGFIHEGSSNAFTLDVADMWRTEITIPLAFSVARRVLDDLGLTLEREVRKEAAIWFRKHKLIPAMIDRIRDLLNGRDHHSYS